MSTKAYILINVKSGSARRVVRAVSRVRGVKRVNPCWGRPDIFAYAEVRDEKTLANLVLGKIQTTPGVEETDTHIIVE